MKRALFSKLSFVPLLVAAGMAGCGDSGNGSGDNSGPCQENTFNICQCAPGVNGIQRCQAGVYTQCDCGGPMGGAGGFPASGGFPQGGAPPGAVCGDGQVTPPEQCDGQNHNGQNCGSVSMGACTDGNLACGPTCQFVITYCNCQPGGGGVGGQGMGGNFSGGGSTGQP